MKRPQRREDIETNLLRRIQICLPNAAPDRPDAFFPYKAFYTFNRAKDFEDQPSFID
jgi:hypothetical protein